MRKKLYIDGMCCCKCPGHVKEGLETVKDITLVEVDSVNKTAIIESSNDIDDSILKEAVKNAGHYSVTKIEKA